MIQSAFTCDMAMKGLVEGDCGGSNPLLRLASHYTQDRGFTNEGLQGEQFYMLIMMSSL